MIFHGSISMHLAPTTSPTRCSVLLLVNFVAMVGGEASGGLYAPTSYYVLSSDGQFMFVMLAPVPLAEDSGAVTKSPAGDVVNLRDVFPASGCYRIGTTSPLWTVDWFDYICRIGDDGRSLVRCNVFGDGKYGRGGQLNWGVKFYDQGVEIRSYDVAELVDFPVLMPYTTSGWHYDWLGDSDENLKIVGGVLLLQTSTNEEYWFDLASGKMLREHRLPRLVAWAMMAGVSLGVILVAWIVVRKTRGEKRGRS